MFRDTIAASAVILGAVILAGVALARLFHWIVGLFM
jgi:hypothetical protein